MDTIANKLSTIVEQTRPWLLSLQDSAVRVKPTPERWSIAEVVGHLIDSACNNHQRFIRAQAEEELHFPKYDQNLWVARANYQQIPWPDTVQLWSLYNLQLSHVIRNIPETKLETHCTITPYEPCTLRFLITDYVDHLNHHLEKIQERVA